MDRLTFKGKKRLLITLTAFMCSLAALSVRVGYIMLTKDEEYQNKAYEQQTRDRLITPKRGSILDRNGVGMAVTESVSSVSVIHAQIKDKEATATALSEILELDYDDVLEDIEERVALKRIKTKVDNETAAEIRALELPGVMIDEDIERTYPYCTLAANVIGFVGKDNQGIIGLESKYEDYLKGKAGKILTQTDSKGLRVSDAEERVEPISGDNRVTSIDVVIQQYAEQEIKAAVEAKGAKSGLIIVMNPQNGEIYAMANYPTFDLNEPFTINDPELAKAWDTFTSEEKNDYLNRMWRNKAINDTYEPGSTFKIVTASAGLEEGVIDESTMVECDGVFDKVDPPLKCWNHAGHGNVNGVDSALKNSCNDYLCEVSYRLGMIDNDEFSDEQALNYIQEYAKMFDLDEKSGIELTESKPKITDNYAIPSAIGQGTNNFSTVQLGRYVTTLANEGTSFQLSLIDKIDGVETSPKVESQIEINKRSWEGVHAGMELYAQSTGIFDGFPISVAGKSGTAQEVKNRPDHGLFIGYAPADDPEIAVAVRIVNGYESGNAVECGKNIFEYYFGIE